MLLSDFWEYVATGPGCWLWGGWLTSEGYGRLWINGQGYDAAHRVAYQLAWGPIPGGLEVMHGCDVRACVRPTHLTPGTHAQNMADMAARGRSPRGERSGRAKFTADQVERLRANYTGQPGEQTRLARQHGVHPSTICKILQGARH